MQRAIFLDRDNTLIEDDGYIHEPEKVKLLPGVGEGLKLLKDAGFLLIVISNQSGIGRGYFKEEDFHAVNKKLNQLLKHYNVQIDDFFFCPHKPDEGCSCRKPEIGLFLRAAEKWNINLKESFMVGDKISDIEAGNRAGCKKSYLMKKDEFLKIAKLITGKR
ncbi:D-glycero-alpha-D-manno-heptose-1,7-bisphosphate 7-phosphatase [Desulfurobacterium indicum]|uniref:D,D-heptose 1,7-bisphosphate phosphatase n=1 Tax=Desulfurobacterium indicum TaxID=1914305 RepID=A0A1R1MJY6_9BACT|nr:HAD family hydrolase [Desulfurobacterium indicum]OMH40121.1 HAD family hydrolase [Desulfurobacterium indicum]